jgi:hypothetical protein
VERYRSLAAGGKEKAEFNRAHGWLIYCLRHPRPRVP